MCSNSQGHYRSNNSLSPAAQAVYDAWYEAIDAYSEQDPPPQLAAALRAVAKELGPKRTIPPGYIFSAPAEQMYHEFRLQVQRDLHAIATELENTDD